MLIFYGKTLLPRHNQLKTLVSPGHILGDMVVCKNECDVSNSRLVVGDTLVSVVMKLCSGTRVIPHLEKVNLDPEPPKEPKNVLDIIDENLNFFYNFYLFGVRVIF